jgi:hypothetical protein
MSNATELLRRAYEALDRFAIYDDLRDEIEAYLATEKEVEPVALKHRLLQIHDALESHLGDSDSWTSEDMTDEEIREEDPIFWAAKEIASLIGDAPWDQYLHPPRPEPARKPIDGDEVLKGFEVTGFTTYDYRLRCFTEGVRYAEEYHGIGGDYE